MAATSDTEAAFLDLHLPISNNIVSNKINDKRYDDFDFEIVKFPFYDGDFISLHSMESLSLSSFVLLEHIDMLMTSTLSINC